MGKIFSPETVEKNDVPEPGAHRAAGRFILDKFRNDALSYSIGGVMVYGSTALGTANIRSDVDVLFTYYPSHSKGLDEIRDVFLEAENDYRVPVEPNPQSVGALFDPLQHTIDPAFAAHLYHVQDNPEWSYNFPATGLYMSHEDRQLQERLRPSALRFSAGKRRLFAKSIVNYRGETECNAFQRALELPNAIGRKVLSFEAKIDDSISAEISSDKNGTIDKTHRRMLELDAAWSIVANAPKAYMQLAELDEEYTSLLENTLNHTVSIASYKQWLQENYMPALKMAHDASDFWVQVIDRDFDTRDKKKEEAEIEELRAQWEKQREAMGDTLPDYDY